MESAKDHTTGRLSRHLVVSTVDEGEGKKDVFGGQMSSYCATVMLNDNGWEAFLFVWANFALCSFDFL